MSAFFAPEFTPFFRALKDVTRPQTHGQRHGGSRSFTPKFDVWETSDNYVIQGELPGVAMDDINIDWHKDTLQISGKVTHSKCTHGASPSAGAEGTQVAEASSKDNHATVEDDYVVADDGASEKPEAEAAATAPTETAPNVNQGEEKGEAVADNSNKLCTRHPQNKRCGGGTGGSFRYWVSELSYGQFNRTFSFPTPTAHDNISATLNNGVLEVCIPKTEAPPPHRIQISRS